MEETRIKELELRVNELTEEITELKTLILKLISLKKDYEEEPKNKKAMILHG